MKLNKENSCSIQNIRTGEIRKNLTIKGNTIQFCIQNASIGKVNGKEEVLDEVLIDNMMEEVAKAVVSNASNYNQIPLEIIIRNKLYAADSENAEKDSTKASDEMLESYEARFSLDDVALNARVREQIQTAIAAIKYRKKMMDEWGMSEHFAGNRAIVLNFYGKAGTGKSMTAEAIAKALGKKVYQINYSELESKYVGETPKNIRKAFACATRDDAVLIFDEADSFLGKRLTSVTQSADYGVNITRSVLLMELEKFRGVVVFTTNLISNYDEAFKRRILLSVHFEMPDEAARAKIWKLHLSGKMPLYSEVTAESLANRYDGVSGADIKDMMFYAALYTLEQGKEWIDFSVFDDAYTIIRERYINRDKEPEYRVISKETISEDQYQKEIKG